MLIIPIFPTEPCPCDGACSCHHHSALRVVGVAALVVVLLSLGAMGIMLAAPKLDCYFNPDGTAASLGDCGFEGRVLAEKRWLREQAERVRAEKEARR